jgi:hypothetical protein
MGESRWERERRGYLWERRRWLVASLAWREEEGFGVDPRGRIRRDVGTSSAALRSRHRPGPWSGAHRTYRPLLLYIFLHPYRSRNLIGSRSLCRLSSIPSSASLSAKPSKGFLSDPLPPPAELHDTASPRHLLISFFSLLHSCSSSGLFIIYISCLLYTPYSLLLLILSLSSLSLLLSFRHLHALRRF